MKYKAKVTRAYYIAIEDEDGNEVATDWCFLDYKEAKKEALELLEEIKHRKRWDDFMSEYFPTKESED